MHDHVARKVQRSLKDVFGLEKLRPLQRKVIDKVMAGEDVLAIMPTGAGKSLCYQLPGLHREGMTVVISPLISLMKDQADKLEELGVEAASLNSALPASEQNDAMESVENEDSDFIFTTPERLVSDEFLETLKDKNVNLVVIDEAHCISQWGHDFRPAFLEIKEALKDLGKPQVLALTATATPEVVDDIRKELKRPNMEVVRGGIYRENLFFSVVHTTNDHEKAVRLVELLEERRGSKIIYCATVKAATEVHEIVEKAGIECGLYHGKLSPKQRSEVQDDFMSGKLKTIVATNAFGMGVDKSNIRAVIHWQIPGSLEAYYQEAGRAGRDGKRAECILLYDTRDRRVQQFFLGGRYPTGDDVALIYRTAVSIPDVERTVDSIGVRTAEDLSKTKLKIGTKMLVEGGIVKKGRSGAISVVKCDVTDDVLKGLADDYVERGRTDREKLEKMMLYAQNADCRWKAFDAYFESGDEVENCGHCDNCTKPVAERLDVAVPERRMTKEEEQAILDTLDKSVEPSLEKGDAVSVKKLGKGKVKSVEGDNVLIRFEGGEEKLIKAEYVHKTKK